MPSYPDRTTNRIFNPLVFARVGCFFNIPSRWSAPCFHPSTGRYSYHVPHSALTAYEILLMCPIATLNFEGSKKTVASTDGKESHGCNRWGMRFGLCRLANIGLVFLPLSSPLFMISALECFLCHCTGEVRLCAESERTDGVFFIPVYSMSLATLST